MYSSFFTGWYGVKFLNGESTGAPAGRGGVAVAALDLFFIGVVAESLDFLAGDFFRLAVLAVWALLAAGRFFGALAVVFADFFAGPDLTVVRDFDCALLGAACFFAGAFLPLVVERDAFALAAVGLLPALTVARPFFAPVAADLLLALRFAVVFLAVAFAAPAGAFFRAACLPRALLVALAAALLAALVRGFAGFFAPDLAAMCSVSGS